MIIERTTADVEDETHELFLEIKPLLDKGYSINQSVKTVKKLKSLNTQLGWYQRIKEYVVKQGYPADVNCMYGRPRKDRRQK